MNIGDVIKGKRKELSLTQSRLAELLGVSVQAVSKWERGVGYPDVSQIVPLAKVLNITTDNLLDNKDRYKELNHHWQIACCKYEGGDESIYTLIDIDEKALKEYPDDYTFLYRRVVDKHRAALDEEDENKKDDLLLSCIGNAHYALSKFPGDDSIISMLARVYAARGERDLALEFAYKSENPQMLLKFVLSGEELRRHRQQLVAKKLNALLIELQDGGLDFLKAEEDIIRALIPDGNYVWYYDFLSMVYINRARIYARAGDADAGLCALESAFALAEERDARIEKTFTSPLFDLLDPERDDLPTLREQLRRICKSDKTFSCYTGNERYKKLVC